MKKSESGRVFFNLRVSDDVTADDDCRNEFLRVFLPANVESQLDEEYPPSTPKTPENSTSTTPSLLLSPSRSSPSEIFKFLAWLPHFPVTAPSSSTDGISNMPLSLWPEPRLLKSTTFLSERHMRHANACGLSFSNVQVWHVHEDAANVDGVIDAMPDGGGGATGDRGGGVADSSAAVGGEWKGKDFNPLKAMVFIEINNLIARDDARCKRLKGAQRKGAISLLSLRFYPTN
mmetsp:Transcript_11505/g.24248  ORF Transcript_11505/g.24248 Transcript_11505/m.24248 type:complete len:232 (+) Transcript_11505:1129-1824(+)